MALKRWNIASFSTTGGTVPETKTLLTAAASVDTVLLSFFISNNSTTDSATVNVAHTNGTSTLYSFSITIEVDNSPFALDSLWVLEPGDEIDVTSDIDDVAILACGDET